MNRYFPRTGPAKFVKPTEVCSPELHRSAERTPLNWKIQTFLGVRESAASSPMCPCTWHFSAVLPLRDTAWMLLSPPPGEMSLPPLVYYWCETHEILLKIEQTGISKLKWTCSVMCSEQHIHPQPFTWSMQSTSWENLRSLRMCIKAWLAHVPSSSFALSQQQRHLCKQPAQVQPPGRGRADSFCSWIVGLLTTNKAFNYCLSLLSGEAVQQLLIIGEGSDCNRFLFKRSSTTSSPGPSVPFCPCFLAHKWRCIPVSFDFFQQLINVAWICSKT